MKTQLKLIFWKQEKGSRWYWIVALPEQILIRSVSVCFGLAAGEPATEPWIPRVILWDQRLVSVTAIELLQCWQRLNYVADCKPQISQSTHVDPTTDSECQNWAMKQPGKRTHLMNDVLFYITRKATCMRVCCLPREEMEAGYTMGTEPASEASKVLPWNLGPLLWSGCCFHTWDARSFTAVAFAHFQTTLEKKYSAGIWRTWQRVWTSNPLDLISNRCDEESNLNGDLI